MAATLCNYPNIELPDFSGFDPEAVLDSLLSLFGISPPDFPTLPIPSPFCPLDALP